MSRTPVTVLTGYLGAGKTTLLNRILDATKTGQLQKRIGVIENEFAAAFGIENEIIHEDKAQDVQSLYEFGWGCVCCSSSGELINALVEIASRNRDLPPSQHIDHVILETTGLADPAPILKMIQFGADGKGTDDIVRNFYLDRIVTVVDAKYFFARLNADHGHYKNEPLAQIMTSDYVILNKVDLLDDKEAVQSLVDFTRQYNQTAEIIPTTYAKVPLETLFEIREYKDRDLSTEAQEESIKTHDPTIEQTMLLVTGSSVDLGRVHDLIRRAIQTLEPYRIKGVLAVPGDDHKRVVQGVGKDVVITLHKPWAADEQRDSRLTFIGKDIKRHGDRLQKEFEECVIDSDPST